MNYYATILLQIVFRVPPIIQISDKFSILAGPPAGDSQKIAPRSAPYQLLCRLCLLTPPYWRKSLGAISRREQTDGLKVDNSLEKLAFYKSCKLES